MENLSHILSIAESHVSKGTTDNAKVCLLDARNRINEKRYSFAVYMALRSLSFSVGILHQDYIRAFALSRFEGPCRLLSTVPSTPPRATVRYWSITRRKLSRNGNPRNTLAVYRYDDEHEGSLIRYAEENGVASTAGLGAAMRLIKANEPHLELGSTQMTIIQLPDVDPKSCPSSSKAKRIR